MTVNAKRISRAVFTTDVSRWMVWMWLMEPPCCDASANDSMLLLLLYSPREKLAIGSNRETERVKGGK